MKFSVAVNSTDKRLKEVVEKAVADYLWLHQGEYCGKNIDKIEIKVDVAVVDRPVDQGVS